eukprot:TRINITY_DN2820_c0_g1_i1.p7 TRINITY_DN2820_c0_g1~~TRINITY_DN2820_c0_g1_i1.p7  ORF type:complete len:139 (+),score=14.81 TRINITY_DN2820_c0_g1_i1:616-1032(+)
MQVDSQLKRKHNSGVLSVFLQSKNSFQLQLKHLQKQRFIIIIAIAGAFFQQKKLLLEDVFLAAINLELQIAVCQLFLNQQLVLSYLFLQFDVDTAILGPGFNNCYQGNNCNEQWPDFGCEGIKVQRAHQPTSQCQGNQ